MSEQLNASRFSTNKAYIDGIIVVEFGDMEVNNPRIPITQKGFYWADKSDNARYSDFKGPYATRELAKVNGHAYRFHMLSHNFSDHPKFQPVEKIYTVDDAKAIKTDMDVMRLPKKTFYADDNAMYILCSKFRECHISTFVNRDYKFIQA